MKKFQLATVFVMFFSLILVFSPVSNAQNCDSTGSNFIDLNGDGYNDNAPDHDGDGIPNGIDPDYIKSEKDGNGNQYRKGNMYKTNNSGITQAKKMSKFQKRNRFSIANQYNYKINGASSQNRQGSGVCNGTGTSNGSMNGGGSGQQGSSGK